MGEHPWFKEFPGSIIVCDPQGVILEMNAKAIQSYEKQGGEGLIGSNMLDCHPEPARTRVQELLASRQPNIYTIERNGVHKFVCQMPWTVEGEYRGIVEIVMEIPAEMPHFVRG
jgi:hypothetical protein